MIGTAEQIAVWLMRQEKSGKTYEIKEHKDKRSLTQNSYYWKLLSILARKLHLTNARLHNLMLRDCSYPFIIGGQMAMQPIPDTEEAENEVLEAVTYHLKPTSGVIEGKNGAMFRWYVVLRGSSTMNTEEMSGLLDRLIAECKEQGIETLPPDELARMRADELEMERRKAQKNKSMCDKSESQARSGAP